LPPPTFLTPDLGVRGFDAIRTPDKKRFRYNVCGTLGVSKGIAHMKSKTKKAPDHNALYRIAEQQAGYFASNQAVKAGFGWERLTDYAKTGHFQKVAHGIYRLTQFPSSRFEDLFAGWLKCGPRSVISHDSALAVYDLSDVMPGEVHVTVPRTASRRRQGVRLHTNRLRAADVVKREGLPITSVPRTIADVTRSGLAEDQVERAIKESLQRGLATTKALLAEASRRGGRAERLIKKYIAPSKRAS
jgi:predicted transcriptional regulator of viral defense system